MYQINHVFALIPNGAIPSHSYTDEILENRLQLLTTLRIPCIIGFYGLSHVHQRVVHVSVTGPILRETIKGATTRATGADLFLRRPQSSS